MLRASLLTVCSLLLIACGPPAQQEVASETKSETHHVDLGKASLVQARFKFPAGQFELHGGAQKLLEGQYRYNTNALRPVVRYQENGTTGELVIDTEEKASAGNSRARWETRLNDQVPLELTLDMGAGEAEAVLGSLNLRKVVVHFGAGQMSLDLRGRPTASYDVEVHGGVGEGKIYWPSGVGVEADVAGGIGDISTDGDIQQDGHLYRSALWGKTDKQVRMHVRGGVGTIKLIAAH